MANQEIARRRTFAIIAHPDAGKTSLTEKLLLFGGQIQVVAVVVALHALIAPALRRTDTGGRRREEQQNQEDRHVRLDGHREAAWYFGDYLRDGV